MITKTSRRWPKRNVETFFDKWNPDMAYVLGYFASDGCMYRNKRGSCYVTFTSTDKELIELVKQLMNVSNRIESYKRPNKVWRTRYVLQIGSKQLYKRLLKIGFTPKKSLTLKYPNIPDKLLGSFFRGYFDGDGCATFTHYKRKDRKHLRKVLSIRIRCGNCEFIKILRNKLIKLACAGSGGLYFHSGAYELVYGAKDVLKLYSFMYPKSDEPCLQRKKDILARGLEAFNVGP